MDFSSFPVDDQVIQWSSLKLSIFNTFNLKIFVLSVNIVVNCENTLFQNCELGVYAEEHKIKIDKAIFPMVQWGHEKTLKVKPMNLDCEVSVTLKSTDDKSHLKLDINLRRKFMRSFIEIITPPGILVIVSWVGKLTPKPLCLLKY